MFNRPKDKCVYLEGMDFSPIYKEESHGPAASRMQHYNGGESAYNSRWMDHTKNILTDGEYKQLSDRLFVKQGPGAAMNRWARVLYKDEETNDWHGCAAVNSQPSPYCTTDDVRYYTARWGHQTEQEFQNGGVFNKPQNIGSSSGVVDCRTDPGELLSP